MNILLSFTGFHDPYSMGLIDQEEQSGPILSLLAAKSFNKIILLETPRTERNTKGTEEAIRELHHNIDIEIKKLNLPDPTDYLAILKGLRHHVRDIIENHKGAKFFVAIASGTPQMHSCWLLLAASGELPAHLLNIRPTRFVTKDSPLIEEIDFTKSEFPLVRANICSLDEWEEQPPNIEKVINQLGIVGDHPSIKKALEIGAAFASSPLPVLILGETGTGKELFAKFIHHLSGRPIDRFVPINCAAMPSELVESLLFGHERGAFTGALKVQIGKFDQANQGTLFLDELGELPLTMQSKLLRVLQDGMVEPIGAQKAHEVDVRVIAATNKELRKNVVSGEFREDLYYRLNAGEIQLPALRERKSDIPKIALHILDRVNSTIKRHRRLTPGALLRLQEQSWPGNVRDLENTIERSVRLSRTETLDADDIIVTEPLTKHDPLSTLPEPKEGFSLEGFISSARKQLILRALELSNGNQSKAARLLGITPQAVNKHLQKIE